MLRLSDTWGPLLNARAIALLSRLTDLQQMGGYFLARMIQGEKFTSDNLLFNIQ